MWFNRKHSRHDEALQRAREAIIAIKQVQAKDVTCPNLLRFFGRLEAPVDTAPGGALKGGNNDPLQREI